MKRPSFNQWLMQIAEVVSLRSPDSKTKVGCVLASMNNKVLGTGYNGPVKGFPNKRESLESGKSGFIHAEPNCFLNRSMEANLTPCKLFITLQPCTDCARLIANLGNIKEVYYKQSYPDKNSLRILKKAGIKVIKV